VSSLDAPLDPPELAALLDSHRSGVLVVLDVELAAINGSRGWAAGDRVLAAFSNMLRQALRVDDVSARSAGQQFVLLLPHNTTDDCAAVFLRLRALWERRAPYPCEFYACAVPVESTAGAALHRALHERSTSLTRPLGLGLDEICRPEHAADLEAWELQLCLDGVRAMLRASSASEVDEVVDAIRDALSTYEDTDGMHGRVLRALEDDAEAAKRRLSRSGRPPSPRPLRAVANG